MKKLMFTAIALVAFSGVSNASKKEKRLNCSNVWNIAYYYARQAGFDNNQASTMAIAAYDKCIGCDN